MNEDDLLAQLPQAVTKDQVLALSDEERVYLVDGIDYINRVLFDFEGPAIAVTGMALQQATGRDLLSVTKVRKVLLRHYRQAGWIVEVDDTERGTDLLFS